MTFEEYLVNKKIHSADFQQSEGQRWDEFKRIFEQMHPDSFTAHKKFIINTLRRSYPMKDVSVKPIETLRKTESRSTTLTDEKAPLVSEEAIATETTVPENSTEPIKKPGKPVMRPIVKKVTPELPAESVVPTSSDLEVTPLPPAEAPKKPARPVIKPVIKKAAAETVASDTSTEASTNTTPEEKPAESKPQKPRPIMRPVVKKSNEGTKDE